MMLATVIGLCITLLLLLWLRSKKARAQMHAKYNITRV